MKNITFLILLFCVSVTANATETNQNIFQNTSENQMLADNNSNNNSNEKRCMMVCVEWEQKCVNDPKSGQENCRKVCKEFGEKCF